MFYLLRENENKALFLAESIQKSFDSINECQECRMYTEEKLCSICTNSDRDRNIMCVVESPADLIAIENTMQFNGLYFVLMGSLSPLDGIGPDELKIEDLIKLLKDKDINEIILANSPTIEGEATASYIGSIAEDLDVKATRIAYGVPMGGELEYVDSNTLIQALNNRNLIGN